MAKKGTDMAKRHIYSKKAQIWQKGADMKLPVKIDLFHN